MDKRVKVNEGLSREAIRSTFCRREKRKKEAPLGEISEMLEV